MTNVLEKEFYHFEHNVGGGTSIHHMDAYLKKKFHLSLPGPPPSPALEILGPFLIDSKTC